MTIPFTNQTISFNRVAAGYNVFSSGTIGNLIVAWWWFVLSYYIYKDIANMIHKVQSGNIEDIQNGNIKEDLL